VERKNIKEEGKEGRWENQKKICFSSLTHTHLCLRHGAHTTSSLSQGLSESDAPNLLNFVPNFANFGDRLKWG